MRAQLTRLSTIVAVAAAVGVLAGCAHARTNADAATASASAAPTPSASATPTASAFAAPTSSASATPMPLGSCQTRDMHVDGVEVTLSSNLDGSLAKVVVVGAPDTATRAKALEAIRSVYGEAKPDTRTEYRSWHLGIARLTDMCGHPIMPTPTPTSS